MKKHLIIFSLILSVFAASAQEVKTEMPADSTTVDTTATESSFCPHRINVYLGGSMTNNIYNRIDNELLRTNYSLGAVLEVKYAYFFTEHWGLSLGVSLANYKAKGTFYFNGIIPEYGDAEFNPETGTTYDLHYTANGLVEKQTIWAIEVPLMAQFEHKFGGKNGLYAQLGVKGFFPFAAKSKFGDGGTITTKGYEEYTHAMYQNMPNHFETYDYEGRTAKAKKMRCSIDVQAEIGGIFELSKIADLYVGVYSSIGLLDILPKQENKVDFITTAETGEYVVNPLMASNFLANYNTSRKAADADFKEVKEKWRLFQVGLKVGFHIKPCATNEPSMRDMKKKYYEEMAKKANEPIIIKNTEYIYIVPTCPDGYEEDDELTQEDKDNIKALADALANTKILFDLDKDIPKVTDNNDNINKTVAVLKKDKSLGLIIEGYTCDLGSEAHNRDLADRRAKAVRQMFIDKGVNPSQIEVAAYTYSDPENKRNIPDKSREEHRAAIFRIVKNSK